MPKSTASKDTFSEDAFTSVLGPEEIKDLPLYPSGIYPHGGTRLREFAAKQALENNVSSSWAEFGVKNGLSANFFRHYLPQDGKLFLFDSFEGLPHNWHQADHKVLPKGTFNTSIPSFVKKGGTPDERMVIVQGWFEDTLPMPEMGTLGFVHVDSDLYSSAKTILERCNDQIISGTIILFDELWGYPYWRDGEYRALMEWDREFKYLARDTKFRVVIEVSK